MLTIILIVVNTAFWIALHFGVAYIFSLFPLEKRQRCFYYARPFIRVSDKQMRFFRWIRLPRWKDKLPQYNRDFEKRHLRKPSKEYLSQFIFMTCQAEVIHDLIALCGYVSVLFCLLCESPKDNVLLFTGIATFIALCNVPFSLIQRYNRKRLVTLYETRFLNT